MSANAPKGLSQVAQRFAGPVAFFGAILIPTPNSGGVTEGAVPGHPDFRFHDDGPAGTFRITTADETEVILRARNQAGVYVDVLTGRRIGRTLNGSLYFNQDAVDEIVNTWKARRQTTLADAASDTKTDEPRLCPLPEKDKSGGRKFFDLLYQEYVGRIVNPQIVPPLSPYLGFKLFNPITGSYVTFDHCIEATGVMVDAKGNYDDLMRSEFGKDILGAEWRRQALNQLQSLGGRGLEWHFNSMKAFNLAKDLFEEKEGKKETPFGAIKLRYTPYPAGVPKYNLRVK